MISSVWTAFLTIWNPHTYIVVDRDPLTGVATTHDFTLLVFGTLVFLAIVGVLTTWGTVRREYEPAGYIRLNALVLLMYGAAVGFGAINMGVTDWIGAYFLSGAVIVMLGMGCAAAGAIADALRQASEDRKARGPVLRW